MVTRRNGLSTAIVLITFTVMVSSLVVVNVEASPTLGKPVTGLENPLTIARSDGGGSDITRIWVSHVDDFISQWVENNGLKGMQITTYDITSKPGVVVSSSQIAFSDVGAYPKGTVALGDFAVQRDHTYKWVFSSSGRSGTSAQYFWQTQNGGAPIADFTIQWFGTLLELDASPSYDPDGLIVKYVWDWNDGTFSEGVTATHQYEYMDVQHWVKLTVTDSGGLESSVTYSIPPAFPYSIVGKTTSWDGTLLPGTDVTITNLRTGGSLSGASDAEYAYYVIDLDTIHYGWSAGDVIEITAKYGTTLQGSTELTLTGPVPPYVIVDITLYPVA